MSERNMRFTLKLSPAWSGLRRIFEVDRVQMQSSHQVRNVLCTVRNATDASRKSMSMSGIVTSRSSKGWLRETLLASVVNSASCRSRAGAEYVRSGAQWQMAADAGVPFFFFEGGEERVCDTE